ncbi:MAG TPA: hypothetical protein VF026_28165 [Ktedonobacteraceae bacterium]
MAIDTTQAAAQASGPVLDPFKDPTFRHGEVETDLEPRFLRGEIVARITESDGESPARIIDANEKWHVDVWLRLHGSLLPMICGSLAFRLIAENIGPGGDDYEREADGGLVKLNPCGNGLYRARISVPANDIKVENTGTPYKLVVAATYLTVCPLRKREGTPYDNLGANDLRPGAMAAMVNFPMTLFIYEGVEL